MNTEKLWKYYVALVISSLIVFVIGAQYEGDFLGIVGIMWGGVVHYLLTDKETREGRTLKKYWRHYVVSLALMILGGGIGRDSPFIGMVLSLGFVYWFLFWHKRDKATDEYHKIIRGTKVEDATKARVKNDGLIHIGAVSIPQEIETSHFLIAGGVGTGKSVAIGEFLDKARERGQRAIVYDPTGEYVSRYYRPEKDAILNPFDQRSVFWTPFHDAKTPLEIEAFSSSLIPEGNDSTDPFWHLAPRAVLSAVMSSVSSMREVNYLLFSADEKILVEVIKSAGKIGQVGSGETFKNVRAQLSAVTSSLRYIYDQVDSKEFSISEFVKKDDDSWLFLSSQADYREELKPLISAWLDIAVRKGLSLPVNRDRRLWFVIDEAASLQKIGAIEQGMAQGRKYGLTFILGLQTVSQFYDTYGKYGGETMLDLPQTKIIMRLTNPETAKWASETFGHRHILRKAESESTGKTTSTTVADQHATEAAILPSQIQHLENLFGYIKMPSYNVIKFKQEYKNRKEIAKDFIPSNLKPFVYTKIDLTQQQNAQQNNNSTSQNSIPVL